jgi:DNA-binding MarR family transcriptional regulator
MVEQNDQLIQNKCRQVARTCIGGSIRRASRAITQYFDEMLAPSGLRSTQFSILVSINIAGSTTYSRLAEDMVMDRTTLTRNIRNLEKHGFVETRTGEDRREKIVTLTQTGLEALQIALPLWQKTNAYLANGLGENSWQDMLNQLRNTIKLVM